MEKEDVFDCDEFLEMKEKRRISREKGKKIYEKDRISNPKGKQKNVKIIDYNPQLDYEDYDYDVY